jgi:cytochrome c-type biogenesis protein CcmH/NrfF
MNAIACSTHALLVDSLLFAGPVVMLVLALVIVTWRERRRERGDLLQPVTPHPA